MPGLEPYAREAALEFLFNGTTSIHISLLSVLPEEGTGEIEISPIGYARVPETVWTTIPSDSTAATIRSNGSTLTFGAYGEDVTVRGWAAYDALTGGNLLASGIFVGLGSGDPLEITIPSGNDIQFQPGNIAIGISSDSGVCDITSGGWSFPWSSPWSGGG